MDKVFDLHSDVLFDLYEHYDDKERFDKAHRPDLIAGGVKGAIWNMYSETEFDLFEAINKALERIPRDFLNDFTVILGLEGLRNIKKAKDIYKLYNLGFRHAMLTWNEENVFGTGAKSNPSHGLTKEGEKLLKLMEKLGMIIDVSHTNEKMFWDILRVANKNIIASHSDSRSICPHVRNLTDQQLMALRAKDGIVGLTLASSFLHEDIDKQTLDTFFKHLDHVVKIMDIDHVSFGFDFMNYLTGYNTCNPGELKSAKDLGKLFEGLRKNGYTEEEINKMTWKNFYDRFHHLAWRG